MNKTLLFLVAILVIGLLFYRVTLALLSDTAESTGNTFTAAESFATPTLTPTPTEPEGPEGIANHVAISEVQIASQSASQDFVELYNPTSSSIDISGWKLRKKDNDGTDTSLAVIPDSTSIQGQGFYLWANNEDGFSSSIGADTSNGNNISSSNSVALREDDDTMVDQVAWGSGTNQFVEGSAFSTNPPAEQSIERKALSGSDVTSMESGADVSKGNGFDSDNNSTDFILRTASQPQNSGSLTEAP